MWSGQTTYNLPDFLLSKQQSRWARISLSPAQYQLGSIQEGVKIVLWSSLPQKFMFIKFIALWKYTLIEKSIKSVTLNIHCDIKIVIQKCPIIYTWYEDFSFVLCDERYWNFKKTAKSNFLLFLNNDKKIIYSLFFSSIFINAIYLLSIFKLLLYLYFTFENTYCTSFSKRNLLKEAFMSTLMLLMFVFISCKNMFSIKEMTKFFHQEDFKM